METKYFEYELRLSRTGELFPAKLAYRTYGDASNAATNAIMLPSCYGGHLDDTLPFLYTAEDSALPTTKYFVIVCGLLGGSESSSPSNQAPPFNGPHFPDVTYEDNIRLQRALCDELGVKKLHAYIGFSMGGQQAYAIASLFPNFVSRIAVLAGSACTSWHNWSFLEGPKAALVNSVDFESGNYKSPARKGTGAFGRVYSTWALSQEWYRQKCWEKKGYSNLESYLKTDWEEGLGGWDANDLLCLLKTWQAGNIAVYNEDGSKNDLEKALRNIKAKVLLMPSRTDQYFPPEDNEIELESLGDAQYKPIESIYGHLAGGGGGTTEDTAFIQTQIRAFVN